MPSFNSLPGCGLLSGDTNNVYSHVLEPRGNVKPVLRMLQLFLKKRLRVGPKAEKAARFSGSDVTQGVKVVPGGCNKDSPFFRRG